MIEWFTTVQVVVACAAGILCLVLGFAGRLPGDLSMGAVALVELLLLAQLVVAIVAPLAGGFWALIERNRWSTVILGGVCLAIAVMVYRMGQIWFVQGV